MGKVDKSTSAWWQEAFRRGPQGCAAVTPQAKHIGKGTENHNPTCVTGRVRSGPSHRGREVTGLFFFFNRGKTRDGTGATREADAAGQEGKNGFLGSSVARRPNARRSRWREFWCAWLCSWALVAGPRRVHLKPKGSFVTLVRLFLERAVPCHIFIKSLSVRISLKSLSLARATRGYRTSVGNPRGGVPSKRTICVICF